MKKISRLIFLLVIFMVMPMTIFAVSDENLENGGSAAIINSCGDSCEGMQRWGSLAGVRITFVDADGHAVSASGSQSYDFTTYVVDKAVGANVYYNTYPDRNKISMSSSSNYTEGSTNTNNISKLSAVVAAYNSYVSQTSGHTSSLNTSGNTGGNLSGFVGESNWFKSLTEPTNTSYADDINAFVRAIADVTGGFNADDLIYEIVEGCNTGEEIFIVMEPLFGWSGQINGSWYNYFGTLADSYYFFSGNVVGGLYNINNMAYLIYYGTDEVEAYNGATGVEYGGFAIQSGADLLSTYGYGMGVDWANDPGLYCNSCSFVNGKFSYDDKLEGSTLVVPSKFGSIQEYAFTSRNDGGAGCCDILKSQISSADNPSLWQAAYDKYCDQPDDSCDGKCVPTEPTTVEVNNCCDDGTESKVAEPELNDLFCEDTELGITYYIAKCKADTYKVSDINDYCELYCTERVEIEIPGSITATSGSYFKLNTIADGVNNARVEGYRRCRVKVYYNEWREKYVEAVSNEVEYYNQYQKLSADEQNYQEAVNSKREITGTVTVRTTCKIANDNGTYRYETTSGSASYSYYLYTFPNTNKYSQIALVDNNYSSVSVNVSEVKTVDHETYSAVGYDTALNAIETARSEAKSNCSGEAVSDGSVSGFTYAPDGTNTNENPESVLSSIQSEKATAKEQYEQAVTTAKELENNIDKCDNYFTNYEGSNAESYNFSPELTFTYSQAYLTETASKQIDNSPIDLEKTCTYEIIMDNEETDVDEISADQYSDVYSTGTESMKDLTSDISYYNGRATLTYDTEYQADKKFTTDAKYHAVCTWKEKDNITYTLVPSGLTMAGDDTTSTVSISNYTIHNREYKIYLSTFDGTYETYWNINNIGHNGKLTNYFKVNPTCANETINSSDDTTLTCKLHVEHELVMTGKCNGSNGTSVTTSTSDCKAQTDKVDLFEFKVIDDKEGNLFPSGTTTSEGEIAYNWTSTEAGQKVMAEIQEKASKDTIYASENVSYSFTLTSKDMKQIKNYNTDKETNDNGYNDFNLHCDETCGENTVSGSGCSKCKSYFLEDLANGTITYNGSSHSISVWNSSSSLEDIRNNNNW